MCVAVHVCGVLLCVQELRQRQVYPVIREADQAETDEEISQVNDCGQKRTHQAYF
jgi:hypothetical protein